jgi:hypothetical protein
MTGIHTYIHSGERQKIIEGSTDGMPFRPTRCFVHREHLAAKELYTCLNEIITQSVQIVNFIKRNALNSRTFSIFCE